MAEQDSKKRGRPANWTPPKGGTRYPQYNLKDALPWAQKLVSKSHLAPQPSDIVYASVVNSKGATAQIKVSALKQFDLLEGSSSAYSATSLAKAISAAPDEEKRGLINKAALAPSVFKSLFDTFHGDEITVGRLKQRAADLNVHPDKTEHCVSIYIETMVLAGLVSLDGDKVNHQSAVTSLQDNDVDEKIIDTDSGSDGDESEKNIADEKFPPDEINSNGASPRAIFHVNVNLDSSLDTEKLEKHLALLKRYGAI